MNKILVVGAGYVGASLGVLLSKKYKVFISDIDSKKIECFKKKQSPISDPLLEKILKENDDLSFDTEYSKYLSEVQLIILALPTNFNESNNTFDTNTIEAVINNISKFKYPLKIIIKSTVPVGFTSELEKKFPLLSFYFVPEFLREGRAVKDNLFPSRIIVGTKQKDGKDILDIFNSIAESKPISSLMTSDEAEAVKLFSNTYLAMRVSFFNELDTFCFDKNMSTKNIIDGVCADDRIGSGYNNPSFGYGGYCLPKDTKQLLSNFKKIPQSLIQSVIKSNALRKEFISNKIISKSPKSVGIFRLIMKKNSDNFRNSAIFEIIEQLQNNNIEINVYEPLLEKGTDFNLNVIKNINDFKNASDLIISNRHDNILNDVSHKLICRDIYGEN
jgi:UDPglucose 6-dehydrogenase